MNPDRFWLTVLFNRRFTAHYCRELAVEDKGVPEVPGLRLPRLRESGYNRHMISYTRRQVLAASALGLSLGRLRALPLEQIKLGITTDEIDDDVLAAVKFLRNYNLKWAEVRNIWGRYNTEQPVEKI